MNTVSLEVSEATHNVRHALVFKVSQVWYQSFKRILLLIQSALFTKGSVNSVIVVLVVVIFDEGLTIEMIVIELFLQIGYRVNLVKVVGFPLCPEHYEIALSVNKVALTPEPEVGHVISPVFKQFIAQMCVVLVTGNITGRVWVVTAKHTGKSSLVRVEVSHFFYTLVGLFELNCGGFWRNISVTSVMLETELHYAGITSVFPEMQEVLAFRLLAS